MHLRLLAELNGDGREDLVGFGDDGVWVSYATPTGFKPAVYSLAS